MGVALVTEERLSVDLGEVLGVLRNHLLPAIRAYGVDNVEISYDIDEEGCASVRGIQYREETGMRFSRLRIPQHLEEQMAVCVTNVLESESAGSGDGTMTIALGGGEVVRVHSPAGVGEVEVRRIWKL